MIDSLRGVNDMEGFWSVQFHGVQGWGTGVVTLINGHVFGGDNAYLYVGTFTQNDSTFLATVHVSPYISGFQSVMGSSEFDLELTGLDMVGAARPKALLIEGKIPGTELILNGTLTKQGDLPQR